MRTLTLLILVIFCGLNVTAQDDKHIVNLTKDSVTKVLYEGWYYHEGDNPQWALLGVDDTKWDVTNISLGLDSIGNRLNFNGIGWFRLHLHVDSSLVNEQLALSIEQAGASEIYIDGKLLVRYGEIGNSDDSCLYFNPQSKPATFAFTTAGEHLIAIRYAKFNARETVEEYDNAIVGIVPVISTATRSIDRYKESLLTSGAIFLSIFAFFAALVFVHFLLWLYHRKDKANLYFSVFSATLSSVFLAQYIIVTASNPQLAVWRGVVFMILAILVFLSLSGLSNELFSNKKLRFYILAAICLASIVFVSIKPAASTTFIGVIIMYVTVECFVLTIRAMYKRMPGAWIVGAGIFCFTLFILVVVTLGLLGGGFYANFNTVSGVLAAISMLAALFAIPISMSVYLGWGYSKMNANLNKQLVQVQQLSEKTIAQEQEKKRLLETQYERLEEEVEERTKEIVAEKQKSDDLLRNILPEEIAEELKQTGTSAARHFDHVTVIFTDFVNFTKAGERLTPQQLVNELDTCFKAFDAIMTKYQIEKIKTIGDAYLAVCGLPMAVEQHAENTIRAAIDIMDYMRQRKQQLPETTFDIRIGIHSGPVVAGIVGVKKFAYDIWGDTVNTAARMESAGESDKINISAATYELVKDKFACIYRGEIAAKNKGDMDMYFVEGTK